MADDLFPTLQPAFMGEWTWTNATVQPPANAQLRFNNGGQTNVSLIWINNITFYGIDASAWLMEMTTGYVIRIEDKTNPLKWQSYNIIGDPVAQSGYVELKTAWRAGGQNLSSPSQTMLSVVSSVVRPTGNVATVSISNAIASIRIRIQTDSFAMLAHVGPIDVTGQLVTREFAYPFQGIHYTSPGMTIRQYYVGQAITGFLASGGPIANLIGKGAELCFRVADSMIEYEARTAGPPRIVSAPVPATPPTLPPQQGPITISPEQVAAMQAREAAE